MIAAPTLTVPQQAVIHNALSDPARLHLLALMADGSLTCQQLEDGLAARYQRLSQPTVAYHLRILRWADLIEGKRRKTGPHGRSTFYRVRREVLATLAETLREEVG